MNLIKKIFFLSFIFVLGISPAHSKIQNLTSANLKDKIFQIVQPSIFNGGISKVYFFDSHNTIMSEISPNKKIKTEKYWKENIFSKNKYHPLFMLSNKELFKLMPKKKISIYQRIRTPSVYNISLKTSSIKKISFTQRPRLKNAIKTQTKQKINKPNKKLNPIYEQVKKAQVEPGKKIKVALLLKNSNYDLAIKLLNDVIKRDPYNAYAFYLKGELYSAQNETEKAMKNYIKALKINPISKESYIGIAKILEKTNKTLAKKYYARANKLQ